MQTEPRPYDGSVATTPKVPMATPSGKKQRRPGRRTTEEVQRLLLVAARELFDEKGYAGATVRDVAQRADVSEILIYRHFGSKAVLFEKAVLEPFVEFAGGWVGNWQDHRAGSIDLDSLGRAYIAGLYELLRGMGGSVTGLLAACTHHPDEFDTANAIRRVLEPLFARIQEVSDAEAQHHGWQNTDMEMAVRAIFSMVVGMSIMDDWLFRPGKEHPPKERIIDELVQILLYGVTARPAAESPVVKRKARKPSAPADRPAR